MIKSQITLCIFIIFYFTKRISSYTIIDVNNLPEPELVKKVLRDYKLKNYNYANYNFKTPKFQDDEEITSHYDENDRRNELEEGNDESNYYKTKLLVKRIVPHGMAPSGIEFDHKFNTAYKPLVRVHKTKTINQFLNEFEPQKYDRFKNKDLQHEYFKFMSPKDVKHETLKQQNDLNDKDLLEPFETSKTDYDYTNKRDFAEHILKNIENIRSGEISQSFETYGSTDYRDKKLQLIKQIQNKITGMKSKSQKLNAYAKVINVLSNVLRAPQFEKSGEEDDPLAPGEVIKLEDDLEEKKTKKWMPHYPPWNFWTYKKTIHEDVCPGTQVKIGPMCIWTPPH